MVRERERLGGVTGNLFSPEHFERVDDSSDGEFYTLPRLVVHIDDRAIEAAGRAYASLLPPNGEVLDLMSSWRSHIPSDLPLSRLVGLGMNAVEMDDNPQLSGHVVHDLNTDPQLPFEADSFDGAINTVSVQYLIHPVEVFAEVYRVLRPGARFVVTFSNRCFPTKAVRIWTALGDNGHIQLVGAYFRESAPWTEVQALDCISPHPGLLPPEVALGGPSGEEGPDAGDPLFAVHARKPGTGST